MQATRESLLILAEKSGGQIQGAVEHLLNGAVKDGLNAARCLLNLEKKVGQIRLEAACDRALYFGELTYGGIKAILEKHMESLPRAERHSSGLCETIYRYARNASQYNTKTIMEVT